MLRRTVLALAVAFFCTALLQPAQADASGKVGVANAVRLFSQSDPAKERDKQLQSLFGKERQQLEKQNTFYLVCIDSAEKLHPLYEQLKDHPAANVIYQTDVYTGRQWLEFMPAAASKANAVLQLKKELGADRLVCFGDGKNDVSMFMVADECYAMGNAVPELKAIATATIDTNNNDGVARWLLENRQFSER